VSGSRQVFGRAGGTHGWYRPGDRQNLRISRDRGRNLIFVEGAVPGMETLWNSGMPSETAVAYRQGLGWDDRPPHKRLVDGGVDGWGGHEAYSVPSERSASTRRRG
jgi:hypothetical protein